MNRIIENFCKIAHTSVEDWDFWKGEHNSSDKIIIAGPSRIIGLIDLNKIDEEIDWTEYGTRSVPTKKMKGNFVFNGYMYGMRWLKDAFSMLGESVEVATYKESILFKLTESIAFGIGNKLTSDEFYYDDKGVMFTEDDFEKIKEEWRTVTKAKEFIRWVDGVAKRKHSGKSTVWYEEVYRWEKFFEEEEDLGDMMLL